MYNSLSCPLCNNSSRLSPFEKRFDIDGRLTEFVICEDCFSILNFSDLSRVQSGDDDRSIQAYSSDQFYAVDQDFLDNIKSMVDQNSMIDFLLQQVPDLNCGVLADFGAGRGITSASAAKHFERVYAIELSLNVLKQVHNVMDQKEKIILANDFSEVNENIDAIVSMHVLEHLPNIRVVIDPWMKKLNSRGVIFFQVPLYKKEHMVSVHYTFFNEISVRKFASRIGFDVVGVWFDPNLDFMTAIIRKP